MSQAKQKLCKAEILRAIECESNKIPKDFLLTIIPIQLVLYLYCYVDIFKILMLFIFIQLLLFSFYFVNPCKVLSLTLKLHQQSKVDCLSNSIVIGHKNFHRVVNKLKSSLKIEGQVTVLIQPSSLLITARQQ